MRPIPVYCLKWHLTRSPSAQDLVVEPLCRYADLELRAWDGAALECPDGVASPRDGPAIFCQRPPPPALWGNASARLVWVPMWDNVMARPQRWWNRFPRHLRVVAFTDAVAERSERAGLRTLRLRYYKDPAQVTPARWDAGRVIFYWNRTGLLNRSMIERLCRATRADKLIFRPALDPGVPSRAGYSLPPRLGATEVEVLPHVASRDAYNSQIAEANIVIAPRRYEGVGMVALEAMARGCAVLGFNAPALSEYVEHRRNGWLFEPVPFHETCLRWTRPVGRQLSGVIRTSVFKPLERLSSRVDLEALAHAPLQAFGNAAAADHRAGFERWTASIPEFARFVFEG